MGVAREGGEEEGGFFGGFGGFGGFVAGADEVEMDEGLVAGGGEEGESLEGGGELVEGVVEGHVVGVVVFGGGRGGGDVDEAGAAFAGGGGVGEEDGFVVRDGAGRGPGEERLVGPEVDADVAYVRCGEEFAGSGKGEGCDDGGGGDAFYKVTGWEVPDSEGGVERRGNEPAAVVTEGEVGNTAIAAPELTDYALGGGVDNADPEVVTGTGEKVGGGIEASSGDAARGGPVDFGGEGTGMEVPELDLSIQSSGDDDLIDFICQERSNSLCMASWHLEDLLPHPPRLWVFLSLLSTLQVEHFDSTQSTSNQRKVSTRRDCHSLDFTLVSRLECPSSNSLVLECPCSSCSLAAVGSDD